MGRAIGIDLGTTNSVVAFIEGGRAEVIPNAEGGKTTPSMVLYAPDGGQVIVGELAKRQAMTHTDRTIRSIKRFMGMRFEELNPDDLKCSYKLVQGSEGEVLVEIEGRQLTPEQISAEVLKKMVTTAEDFLGEAIDTAVITVPAYFNDSQRTATKRAGELAGLEVIRIVNEPTAAALAYGLKREAMERVAIFDFGGGTFDISILDIDEDVFEVKSTNGDTRLGGDAIDLILTECLCRAIQEETGVDPQDFPESYQRVYEAAERCKCELSTMTEAVISLPFIVSDASGPKHFNETISREQLEDLIEPVLARLESPCRQALEDARLTPKDITHVLLVGGSTRIPAVRRRVREIFGQEPSQAVNPDEAVAAGAAIQAGVLTGALQEVLLLDVTPLSLGIEIQGGVFSILIPRNSTIPTSASKTFTTVRDFQKSVRVHALQGERRVATENRTLAHFRLEDIDPAPREIPEISVTFAIDANGILNVSAQDLSSGASKEVTIEHYGVSTAEEVEKQIEDAQQKVEMDREFMALARMKTRNYRIVEVARDYLAHHEIGLSEEEAKTFHERIFRLDAALAGSDSLALDSAAKEVQDLANYYADLVFMEKLL